MIEKEVYAQLRSEMTNIYSSFRQLLIVQYAGFAALAKEEIKNRAAMSSMSFGLLVAVMILLVTLAGSTWFIQAIRIGSYLMLNFELGPAGGRLPSEARGRAHMWILANRSESLGSKQRKGLFNRYLVGAELRNFYAQQFVLALLATGVSAMVAWKSYSMLVGWHLGLCIATGILLWITLVLAVYGFFFAGDMQMSTTRSWQQYYETRAERDREYLEPRGLADWPPPSRSGGGAATPRGRTGTAARIAKDIEHREELIAGLSRELSDSSVYRDPVLAREGIEQYQQVIQEIDTLRRRQGTG